VVVLVCPLAFPDWPSASFFSTSQIEEAKPVDFLQLSSHRDQPTLREGSSVDILIPVAFPFPSLGSILALMFVLFGGWYIGASVPISQYPALAIAGMASLFGGTVLALPFLFDMLRLPAELFQVFITVDVIGSRFGTQLVGGQGVGELALESLTHLRPRRLRRHLRPRPPLLPRIHWPPRWYRTAIVP
jgi:hypothetical protein